jgi:hypothetical protein
VFVLAWPFMVAFTNPPTDYFANLFLTLTVLWVVLIETKIWIEFLNRVHRSKLPEKERNLWGNELFSTDFLYIMLLALIAVTAVAIFKFPIVVSRLNFF